MDYEVTGPQEKIILDGTKEKQGDFVFTALESGEYKFCFNNEMSTFAEKFVDFEIAVSLHQHGLWVALDHKLLLTALRRNRLRMKLRVLPYLLSKAHLQNRHLHWRSQSSSFPASSRPLPETKSTSAHERIETSARSEAQREGSLTSALLRA